MIKAKKALPWAAGLILATALFAGLQLISYLRFENSDDVLIVKAFMGFEGGVPATYNLYLHTFLAYGLGWLSTVLPGVAWFSLLQLFLLWFSTAVIVKCVVQSGMARGAFPWAGIGLSLVFCAVIAAFACARINFTTTAALTGAAAAGQLCTLRDGGRRLAGRAALSVLLLLCCYALRYQSFIAALPFWLLALGWLLLSWRRAGAPAPRAFIAVLLAGVLCFGLFVGVRAVEEQAPDLRELTAFQEANLGPMDYDESALLAVSDDTLSAVGWSRAELKLVRQWYFMDENITAAAFDRLNAAAAAPQKPQERAIAAVQTLAGFYRGNSRYLTSGGILLLLALGCVLMDKPAKGWPITGAAAALAVAGTGLMLLYLAYQGRFLARAADCALFPAAAVLCCWAALLSGNAAEAGQGRRVAALALCGFVAVLGAVNGWETAHTLRAKPDVVSATRESDLETYALQNPDKLILRTPDLLRDTRLLPDVSAGIPGNIMIWGDWYCRTPSWYHQLEVYGFDGRHFTAVDFLKDDLLFATEADAPPEALLTYISEGAGRAVTAVRQGSAGEINFFSFQ